MPKIPQNYVISVLNFDDVEHLHAWLKEREIEFDPNKDLDCKAIRSVIFKI